LIPQRYCGKECSSLALFLFIESVSRANPFHRIASLRTTTTILASPFTLTHHYSTISTPAVTTTTQQHHVFDQEEQSSCDAPTPDIPGPVSRALTTERGLAHRITKSQGRANHGILPRICQGNQQPTTGIHRHSTESFSSHSVVVCFHLFSPQLFCLLRRITGALSMNGEMSKLRKADRQAMAAGGSWFQATSWLLGP